MNSEVIDAEAKWRFAIATWVDGSKERILNTDDWGVCVGGDCLASGGSWALSSDADQITF